LQGESHSGCTHFLVEVDKAQLEAELMTPGMVQLWKPWVSGSSCEKGNSSRGRKTLWGLKNVWHDLCDYLKDQG